MSKRIGKVIHYYDKIRVAVVELEENLCTENKIKFIRGGEDLFSQVVESIQHDHDRVECAEKGQSVGIQTIEPVKEGAEVYFEEDGVENVTKKTVKVKENKT
jgi:hypothetical protein